MPAGSQHCGMIPIQSDFPLLLEHVLLVWWFFATPVFFGVFVFLQVPVFLVSQWCVCSKSLVGQRWCLTSCSVIFVWLQFYMRSSACWIATLWHDTHSVWFSIHFWAHLLISLKLCRFSFIWQIVFFPVSVFFVLHWYVSSRSLVGHRWCLTSCSVNFLWLQRDMRSSACWIATLWHDTHSVCFSSAFRARFISVMILCHYRFLWRVCVPTGSRVLGITVVCLFEILGWSTLMFDVMFGIFRLTAVLHALICLLDRNTVAWYLRSLRFLCF